MSLGERVLNFSLAIAILFPGVSARAVVCPRLPGPAVLEASVSGLAQVWTLSESDAYLAQEAPVSPIYQDMLQWVRSYVDPDPIELIQRQRSFFARPLPEELPAYDQVLSGKVGRIRSVSCLEARLLEAHLARSPFKESPTEFQALILERGGALRAYFASADLSGRSPSLAPYLDRIREDLRSGWVAGSHLHNHPFKLGRAEWRDIGGATIPSRGDVEGYLWYHEQVGMKEALVTNGISTIEVPFDQIRLLRRSELFR